MDTPCIQQETHTEIQEHTLTDAERAAIPEFRRLLAERIESYLNSPDKAEFLQKHKIPVTPHWSVGNEKFQRYPDDEGQFGTETGYFPANYPFEYGKSCFSVEYPDFLLLRFLRARNTHLPHAVDLFFRMLVWREQYGANDMQRMLCQPHRRLWRSFVRNSFSHSDKFHRPVYYELTGAMDAYAFSYAIRDEEVMLSHVWLQEWHAALLQQRSAKHKKRIDQSVFVIDMQGAGLGHRKLARFFNAVSHVDADCYPESMGCTYILNCPAVFPVLWALVSKLLPTATTAKIKIFSKGFEKQLCEELGEEFVPPRYGGKCACQECFSQIQPLSDYDAHSPNYDEEKAKLLLEEEIRQWKLKNHISDGENEIKENEVNEDENHVSHDATDHSALTNDSLNNLSPCETQATQPVHVTSPDLSISAHI